MCTSIARVDNWTVILIWREKLIWTLQSISKAGNNIFIMCCLLAIVGLEDNTRRPCTESYLWRVWRPMVGTRNICEHVHISATVWWLSAHSQYMYMQHNDSEYTMIYLSTMTHWDLLTADILLTAGNFCPLGPGGSDKYMNVIRGWKDRICLQPIPILILSGTARI